MCIFANEFSALFCVSFHPEIDPICLSLQKEELLDLKRQRAETDRRLVTFVSLLRQKVCDICPNHSLPPAFLDLFQGHHGRGRQGALAILTLIVAIISAQWPAGCPLMMVGDSAECFLKSMKSRPQKLCCREICRQTGTGAAQHNPNVTSDSESLTIC